MLLSSTSRLEPQVSLEAPSMSISAKTFAGWYKEHFPYVFHTLRRLGVAPSDLEDMTHDVFVVLYRTLDRYDVERPLKPWLFGIAFRLTSDYKQRAFRWREVASEDKKLWQHRDPSEAPDANLAFADEQKIALDALADLDLDQRAVFILHELDGYTIPEAAEALKIPINTLYSRLRRGRERFAQAVEKLLATRRGSHE